MTSVGRYEVLRELGRGGMGIVYLARQRDLDRLVALKELNSVHAATPEIAQRFVRESRLAGSLNHPNIVTVYDYVEEGGTSYIAMEYMPRGSLRPWVGDLSLAQLAGVLEGLLSGLAAVEPSGIVHRDLKPENVMVAGDGRVKITDFGIAKATQSANVASFMTATGATVGTPAYMAPEQALSKTIGPWTDLYSVGVMTYEQLVGRLPFHDSPTPVAILLRHVNDPIPPVLESRPDIDPSLSEWVARLLVKEPVERTPNAMQAWEELEEIVLGLLGPRWRRSGRLPERSPTTSSLRPLTPAPFESHSLETPHPLHSPRVSPAQNTPSAIAPRAPTKPETESGFISYGRAPTGAELNPQPRQTSPTSPVESQAPSADREGVYVSPRSTYSAPPAAVGAERAAPGWRARRLGAIVVLTVLTAAAGFALASAGEGARTTTHGKGASAKVPARGPNRAYATSLGEAMSKLNGERTTASAQFARAGSARTQAAAATVLAHAHESAAAAVRSAPAGLPERTANAAIAAALAEIGRGYSTMATAARHEDPRAFDGGRRTVRIATTSLTAPFAQLHQLGYRLGG